MKKRLTGRRSTPTPLTTSQIPSTLFKNSLRAWQARWKSQQAGVKEPEAAGTEKDQAAPGSSA